MNQPNFMTETISCDVSDPRIPPVQHQETEFEKPRGVRQIEVRRGYTQVHVSKLGPPSMPERLRVLEAVAEAGINIDFLKLTPDGLSFLVARDRTDDVVGALQTTGVPYEARRDRSIVLVHAVNMRDEEGLIAEIVHAAISSGARVDHMGDMHDRLLMIVHQDQAIGIEQELRRRWSGSE